MTVGEQLIQQGLEKGLEKGRQEGLEKSRQEEKLAVARKALAKGMPPEEVAELVALPLPEIQKLVH